MTTTPAPSAPPAEPAGTTAPPATPDPANGSAAEGTPENTPPPSTFSQADLDRIVAERVRREREKFKDYKDLQDKAAKFDQAAEAQKTAEQRAQEAATAAEKRAGELLQRAVRSEIRALAADKFADPEDPGGFLDATRYVNATGDVDTAAIRADLDDLLTRKPHLAKAEPGPRPPAPNPAQGSSGSTTPPANVSPGVDRLRYAYGQKTPK